MLQMICAAFLFVTLAACSSYKGTGVAVPQAGRLPFQTTVGSVSISADPYVTEDRQKAIFDGKLYEKGIVAIHLVVQNSGERRLLVRRSDMLLVLPNGMAIATASPALVAEKFNSRGDIRAWTLGFGIVGGLIASANAEEERAARKADYQNKEFKEETTLIRDDAAHGFLYFVVPPHPDPFDQATLSIKVVDVQDGAASVIVVPLTNLKFPGGPKSS
ncbi:MAG TPA: hypothetical protein VKD71_06510 [Gemmataceae bacterium]|nr:hypothetical protein [Gemmataceae bacterium]